MVGNDVMNVDDKQMLLRAATDEKRPQKNIGGEIEAGDRLALEDAPGFLLALFGGKIAQVNERKGKRNRRPRFLHGLCSGNEEASAQRVVPLEDVGEGGLEGVPVEQPA